ncbi:hypothetical protein [Plantactinospora sp. B24E8]|uniref:hypothetical protein n=1 Tax=Plantactinospora sp. B24E8 TaxID=3153567 RepID=UPI00325F746E
MVVLQRAEQRGGGVDVLRVWDETRTLALAPAQAASPLPGRPYDLRHAPAPEVADRTGHSVDVLLKVYAKCLDGDRSRMNERVERALAS